MWQYVEVEPWRRWLARILDLAILLTCTVVAHIPASFLFAGLHRSAEEQVGSFMLGWFLTLLLFTMAARLEVSHGASPGEYLLKMQAWQFDGERPFLARLEEYWRWRWLPLLVWGGYGMMMFVRTRQLMDRRMLLADVRTALQWWAAIGGVIVLGSIFVAMYMRRRIWKDEGLTLVRAVRLRTRGFEPVIHERQKVESAGDANETFIIETDPSPDPPPEYRDRG